MDTANNQGNNVETTGPRPFISRKVRPREDGSRETLNSRHHRKGLARFAKGAEHQLVHALWRPRDLNWWIGAIFAIGSTLFALASVLFLSATLAQNWSLPSSDINRIYFLGSIPFTTAAYLQLYQAANAPTWIAPRHTFGRVWLGWRPRDIGWTSCALQFAGTLLFNINTFNGMQTGMSWLKTDLAVWMPDVLGSVLFLASGYLAFAESCHRYFAWIPHSLSWWITVANLLGCLAFMVSAIYAFTPPAPGGFGDAGLAVAFTLAGAGGFFVGSLLMMRESVTGATNEQ